MNTQVGNMFIIATHKETEWLHLLRKQFVLNIWHYQLLMRFSAWYIYLQLWGSLSSVWRLYYVYDMSFPVGLLLNVIGRNIFLLLLKAIILIIKLSYMQFTVNMSYLDNMNVRNVQSPLMHCISFPFSCIMNLNI